MILRLLFILSVFFTTLFSSPVFALGKLSHQIVCQLTYDLLPLAKQQKIDSLLNQLPEKQKKLINSYNRVDESSAITFANSCTWADAIKKNEAFDSFKPWHYINIERNSLSITKDTCKKDCITQAINYHKTALSDSNNTQEKAEALMFLGHWLGDIHQPLHVSFSSDYGGNRNKISPFVGRCNNLHWYWDECLLYTKPKSENKTEKFDYLAFKKSITRELSSKLALSPKEKWIKSNVTDWANESLTIIREEKFNYCQLNETSCESKQNEKITITKEYHQHYQVILHKRMLQAAVRLFSILEKTL